MKILFIHQYFKVPSEPGGTRSYWIAKRLVQAGHSVIMVTSSNNIERNTVKLIDGIVVIYLKVRYEQSMSIWNRFASFFTFMIRSTLVSLNTRDIDLVIGTSTPLSIGFPCLILRMIKRVPYIFEVRDLWPEVPIQMGAIKNRFLKSGLKQFEKTIYKNAAHIIALSPGMADGIKSAGVSDSKITVIPNMAKIDEFMPKEKNIKMIEDLGLRKDSFKVIHFGAIGIANNPDFIINSAKLLKDNAKIEFIFIGGGSLEDKLKKECITLNLCNVHFLGNFPMKDTSEIVNLSDVSIISFQDIPILYTNSPNKFFDSLSAGKPVIVNSNGWTKDIVEKYKCGTYVNPSNPSELAKTLMSWINSPTLVRQMGINARLLAESEYDKSILCEKFASQVETIFKLQK